MRSWMSMMAAGAVGLVGGFLAFLNPSSASVTAVTIAGVALLLIAGLQGWSAYTSAARSGQLRAGAIAAASGFLGLSLLFGPLGDGGLLRWLVGLLLLASGGAKGYSALAMKEAQNKPLVLGTAAASVVLGVLVLIGYSLNFGLILGLELLSSGLGLVLLAMHRRSSGTIS